MNDNNVAEDFAAFGAMPPEEAAKLEKARQKAKEREKVTPAQIKATEKLAEHTKAEKEAALKGALLRQLQDYRKLIAEYYPERAEYLRVPKNVGVKNTVEELRIYIDDIKAELGKKSGLTTMKMIWVEGSRLVERANVNEHFGLKTHGLGQAAEHSVMPRRLESGEVIPGPAVPTLAEFCVEHSNWFQSSVNYRMVQMFMEMVAGVHRMNSMVPQAQEKKASKESEELMKDL